MEMQGESGWAVEVMYWISEVRKVEESVDGAARESIMSVFISKRSICLLDIFFTSFGRYKKNKREGEPENIERRCNQLKIA